MNEDVASAVTILHRIPYTIRLQTKLHNAMLSRLERARDFTAQRGSQVVEGNYCLLLVPRPLANVPHALETLRLGILDSDSEFNGNW